MASILRRALGRIRRFGAPAVHPLSSLDAYLPFVRGRAGLEIGGPSNVFTRGNVVPIYDLLGSLDNCDFSDNTVWREHGKEFIFSPRRPAGKSFFCEGSNLTPIAAASYDFLLSSHNLEHFANPIRALQEWKRVLRPGGALVLILPDFRKTFDHRRSPTPVANMMEDFENGIGEDDLSHLSEILDKHDLTRDPQAGKFDHFKQRSLDNIQNRCLHHHVFDEANSRDLLTSSGFHVHSVELAAPLHICLLATK
jgi:SAM-dependent methyltransferase